VFYFLTSKEHLSVTIEQTKISIPGLFGLNHSNRDFSQKDAWGNMGSLVWNTSKVMPEDQFPGLLLSALFGYTDKLYLVPAIAYIGFIVSIGSMYFRSLNPPKPQRSPAPVQVETN
jgi:hypothetical protein